MRPEMRSRLIILGLAVVVVIAAIVASSGGGGGSGGGGRSVATDAVAMRGTAFDPSHVSVKVGDTVTWTNHDTAPHNVVVTDGPEKFTSPTLQTGGTYSHTFT
ncbi:MAG: hypothetical protein QOF65_2485, partial [Thermoleophilaceae bacterium]|nr:hypothetical protein [Thermoleophilaceae bacterium]